ncbi:hypothetical protein [Streptomyces caniscabiei]|uniref:hypothetical protein n=1 Tax=Streptomyces caniscabiei TaxID=2746961 RepID=UPI0029B11B1E|nr:hypothetical protein [Streptomyces caniscabiei]MDX2954571.1 hypothetical protein [Streptomyces caniscabiei]
MTDTTDHPSRRAGLRDELVKALGRITTVPPVAHRRAQADHVLGVLYREWPWLRAEAEDAAASVVVPAADRAAPVLTAEEARALAEDLGYQLYRAQDALAFVGECCDIADREQRPVTTADVREWLKGARCGRQVAVDAADRAALRDRIAEELAARFTSGAEYTQGMRVAFEGPDGGPATRMVTPFEAAEAVLAVLPAPADRAAVLEEAADKLAEFIALHGPTSRTVAGWTGAEAFLRRMAAESAAVDRVAAETPPAETETVHACPPDGSGLTPCCGRTPFELPRTDRMTRDPAAVTCRPAVEAQPGKDTETP